MLEGHQREPEDPNNPEESPTVVAELADHAEVLMKAANLTQEVAILQTMHARENPHKVNGVTIPGERIKNSAFLAEQIKQELETRRKLRETMQS